MFKAEQQLLQWLSLFVIFEQLFYFSGCEVGTASHYNAPYTPTACFGDDPSQFPTTNMFAAASEAIWDNGAACGRQYLVRCISAPVSGSCISDRTILINIVDRAYTSHSRPSNDGTIMVLSAPAFQTIANRSTWINVEFQQY